MRKFHVKKNDEVVILAGADRHKRGRIIAVLGKQQRVIVEGTRMIKRHTRKNPANPQGKIIEREGSIHISNVMKAESFDARAAKHAAAAPETEPAQSQ
jgi:large subunit ribosomal protein L24